MAADLERGVFASLILVSAGTGHQLVPLQRELAKHVALAAAVPVVPVIVPLGLRQSQREYDRNEVTQRSRGFVFAALGSVAALMAGASSLRLYENGIGAINLPYTSIQLGAQSTRSAHPEAVSRMSAFIRLLLERPFTVELPFALRTKGELCRALAGSPLASLARLTVSCDGFPQRLTSARQCGVCTSCLLRRLSLAAAGIADPAGGQYRFDVSLAIDAVPRQRLVPLTHMLDQVDRLRQCLASADPWHALVSAYPDSIALPETLVAIGAAESDTDARRGLLSLLDRYCDEWPTLPARPRGWSTI